MKATIIMNVSKVPNNPKMLINEKFSKNLYLLKLYLYLFKLYPPAKIMIGNNM